jgi:hypothetical protein
MLRNRLLRGVWIGLVAAAATAGALVGFGWVRGSPAQPLNTVAHVLIGSRAFYVHDVHPVVTSAALLVHLASLVLWGVLFALAVRWSRGTFLWLGVLLFAALIAAVDFLILPPRLSPGFETILTRGEVIIVYAVMAASFGIAASMRPEERHRAPANLDWTVTH